MLPLLKKVETTTPTFTLILISSTLQIRIYRLTSIPYLFVNTQYLEQCRSVSGVDPFHKCPRHTVPQILLCCLWKCLVILRQYKKWAVIKPGDNLKNKSWWQDFIFADKIHFSITFRWQICHQNQKKAWKKRQWFCLHYR